MKTTFSTAQSVSELTEFEVPKPPAPPKPSSSALANAASAVAAPTPDQTPVAAANDAASKINIKAASIGFNGKCLEKDDQDSIKSVSCNAKFMALLTHFD